MAGSALCVLAVGALWLPWWESARHVTLLGAHRPYAVEQWRGYEITGSGRHTALAVLAVLAVAAVVIARVRRSGWAAGLASGLVAAAGAAVASTAVAVLASWGRSAAWGAVVTLAAGLCAAAAAVLGGARVTGRTRWIPLAGVALGLLVLAVPAPDLGLSDAGRRSGPYTEMAAVDGDVPFRSGIGGLGALVYDLRLTVVAGQAAVATRDGLVTVDENGRADVLARLDSEVSDTTGERNPMLGVAGDRVVHWIAPGELAVSGLLPSSGFSFVVTDVAEASPVGVDGSVWLRAFNDEPGTLRRLDVAAVDGRGEDAHALPAIDVEAPRGTSAAEVLPVDAGALTVRDDARRSDHLVRLSSATETLVGGLDPACGLVGDGLASHLPLVPLRTLSPDRAGGVWFAVNDNYDDTESTIAHVDAQGVLRAMADPAPGSVTAMTVDGSGTLVMAVGAAEGSRSALWALPDAAAHLDDLPPPGPDCVAEPPSVGPSVTLTPVPDTSDSPLGIPLGADGRWADAVSDELFVVDTNGNRASVGRRLDGNLGEVVPDGSGGMWWTEVTETGQETSHRLVHGRPGESQERPEPVTGIDNSGGTLLIPDLTGAPPLLGSLDGAFELIDGLARQVFDGPVDEGIIGPDGRGWLLSEGRLLRFDGQNTRAVIDSGERAPNGELVGGDLVAPVSVQLARGVRPQQLILPRARLSVDAGGRPLAVSDDVVLTVADDGSVQVVAQDDRLLDGGVWPVEGGTVVLYVEDFRQFRLDIAS